MKVTIRNLSKKPRGQRVKTDLKQYSEYIATELGISDHIKEIRLEYQNDYFGYYGKKGPFQGFELLWSNGRVRIIFANNYDQDQFARKSFIVHELTHVKQLIMGELEPMGKEIKWRGRFNHTWKKFSFKAMEKKQGDKAVNGYIRKHFPWEKEVQANCDYYENQRDSR